MKTDRKGEAPAGELSLEEEFDQAMQAGRPIFVFLHSLDCNPCQVMMENVAEVYPEFEEEDVLIDVNV
ncbi:MAG: thioredoxin family protein [Anaerolineales bacterium]|nr:thioredoxin family protein [Anaerolineales bacterium]